MHSPRFSVIVPLLNDRDSGPACVASWLAQTHPADDYEIILVTPRPHGRWERALQAKLRPGDQFLGSRAGAETLLWDVGVRSARGEWILFTEAHCVADPHCLLVMSGYLQGQRLAGACCQSIGIAKSPAARIDERLFQEGFQRAIQPDCWRKLVMHGAVLNRRIYLELGGFDVRLGRFAEWVLERRLHDADHQLGYAAGAIVRHVFRDSVAEIIPQLVSYTEGECAFQVEQPHLRVADFTCFPVEWRTGHEPNPSLARFVAKTLAWNFWRDLWRGQATWKQWNRAVGAFWRLGLRGRRLVALRAWWAMQRALFQSWRRRRDEAALEPEYRRLHVAIVRWARLRFLANQSVHPEAPRLAADPVAISDFDDEALIGFHCLEQSAHGLFRWSRAVAGLEFHLDPADCTLRLYTGGLRGHVRPAIQEVFFNGRRIPRMQLGDDGNDPLIPLAAAQFQAQQPQRLVLVCRPEDPARLGEADRRELGIPLLGIGVVKAA